MLNAGWEGYCTVSASVAVCVREPDVAVTVTFEVVAAGVPVLQPETIVRPNVPTASSSNTGRRRRFLQPRNNRAAARVAPGRNGLELL